MMIKLLKHIFLSTIVLLLTSCVTMNDLDESLVKLNLNSQEKTNYKSPKQAAQALYKKCLRPPVNKKHPNRTGVWDIEIDHHDSIISQGKLTGYFKVLCLDLKNRANKLKITGVHAGGGMGKAFFLLPKVTIYDAQWNKVQHILKNVKQNSLTGNLEMYQDISRLLPATYYVVFEADNRAEGNEIGDYLQGAYAIVPMIVKVKMYSLPVGKERLEIVHNL